MFSLIPAKEQLQEILYIGSVAGAKAPTFFYVPDYFTGGNRPDPVPARKEQK